MKRMKAVIVSLSMFCVTSVFAQRGGASSPSLSLGFELGVPTGDFSNANKAGLGGSLKAAIPIFDNGDFTVSAGYISYGGKQLTPALKLPTLSMIPLKAGLRVRSNVGLYFEPQLGYTNLKYKNADSDGGFTYAANFGYMFAPNWDISARYEGVSVNNATFSQVGFRLAYSFSL